MMSSVGAISAFYSRVGYPMISNFINLLPVFTIPPLFVAALAFFVGRAILRGIANARDEHHRVTPQSPWFYFALKARRPLCMMAGISIPWLFLCAAATVWAMGEPITWANLRTEWYLNDFTSFYFSILTNALLVCCVLLWKAPMISSPIALASIASGAGFLAWFVYLEFLLLSGIITDLLPLAVSLTLGSILLLYLICRTIRDPRDAKWFRFNDLN